MPMISDTEGIPSIHEGEDVKLEYVTDPRMGLGWRVISNMKDALAYFGFRQVFRGRRRPAPEPP